MADDIRRGPVRQLLVRRHDRVEQRVGEITQPRPEDDRDLRPRATTRPNGRRRCFDLREATESTKRIDCHGLI